MKASHRPYHHGNLREALLRAAAEVLEARGAQGLSLRELSRELGVSHTSPRRHFADKQALLDALAHDGFDRLGAVMGRAAKEKGEDFSVRLIRMSRAYVNFALKHPAWLSLMFEAKHRPGAPRELLEASEKALVHMPAIFREGQAKGEVVAGDPGYLALVVGAALQGLVALSTNGKFHGVSVDALVGEIVESILLGLRPRP